MITIVGAGLKRGELTADGLAAIKGAPVVASRHAMPFRTTDLTKGLSADSYEALDQKLAAALLALEREHGAVVLAVRGDGFTDTLVPLLQGMTQVAVIPGVSPARGRRPSSALTYLSACDIIGRNTLLDSNFPLYIYGLEDRLLAGEVKLRLLADYPPELAVVYSHAGGEAEIALTELDRQKSYREGALFLPGNPDFLTKKRYTFADLSAIMNRLTDPDGCPWDRAQTHGSIRVNLIEEAYEAADALAGGDPDDCIEELGDVLLQVVFHANIGARSGEYGLSDIVTALCQKLVSRHTHIFGADRAADPDEALTAWEAAKAKEKRDDSLSRQLNRLPGNFPSLLLLQKTVKKAVKAGLPLRKEDVLAALAAAAHGHKTDPDAARLLYLSAVYAALAGLDPEVALLDAAAALKEAVKRADGAGTLKQGIDL